MIDNAACLTLKRGTPEPPDTIVVFVDGKEVLEVPPGRAASVVLDPGNPNIRILFRESDFHFDVPDFGIEERGRITFVVSLFQPSRLERLKGKPGRADLEIVIDTPRPWPTVTSQFWVGRCDNNDVFWNMFGEREFPEAQTDEEQWAQDDTPISLFAETQDEIYLDHDFNEGAYVGDDGLWRDRVGNHSWSQFWADDVLQRAKDAGQTAPNSFFMCGFDSHDQTPLIRNPRDIKSPGVDMVYIGEIVHRTE